jgi:hypothetical protein
MASDPDRTTLLPANLTPSSGLSICAIHNYSFSQQEPVKHYVLLNLATGNLIDDVTPSSSVDALEGAKIENVPHLLHIC